jgi:hypothetical protein
MNSDIQQIDATGSANFNTTTGYATGTTCTFSGTYRASNRYMDIVGIYAKGEIFRVGPDGKKTTWYALTSNLSTNQDGGFSSVKVQAGAA